MAHIRIIIAFISCFNANKLMHSVIRFADIHVQCDFKISSLANCLHGNVAIPEQ